jgi:hypothetical protein
MEMYVFQPTRSSIPDHLSREVKQGFLKIIIPENADEKKVSQAWKDFNTWAQLMEKNLDLKTAFFRFKDHEIPFFGDMSSSQILADMKKGLGERVNAERMDSFFSSLLFIFLAQNYDAQTHEIAGELESVSNMEKELFQNMMGDTDGHSFHGAQIKPLPNENPGDQMVKERMAAWSHLFLKDMSLKGTMMPPFFVTSNQTVMTYLADVVPELEVVAKYHPIPVSEDDMGQETELHKMLLNDLGILAHHLKADASIGEFQKTTQAECRQTVSLTVNVIPDVSPADFLLQFAKPNAVKLKKLNKIKVINNTLIGLIKDET